MAGNLLGTIDNLPEISFIEDVTLDQVVQEMIQDYEEEYQKLTRKKKSLSGASEYRAILYACAVQIYQAMQYVDKDGKMDLLKYSYGRYLDNLAALKGLTRNPPKKATMKARFLTAMPRESVILIPRGTRIAAGNTYFQCEESAEIKAGETSVDVSMTCIEDGEIGNGFQKGDIDTLVDLIPYISSVSNITKSNGGTEEETDENFAERIFLFPSSYSVAGPEDAYKYWAKTFHQDVQDVKVFSTGPGIVDVSFILSGGEIPDEKWVSGMQQFLSDEKIRPLTDFVKVAPPDLILYNISAKYYINKSDSSQAITIQKEVLQSVEDYVKWQNSVIGRDINPSELISRMMRAGARRVEIMEPSYVCVLDSEIAQIKEKELLYGGVEDD